MTNSANTIVKSSRLAGFAALALLFGAASALASPILSGGASGGGALQGGDGAPGSGVGIPGAIVNNLTAEAIDADGARPGRSFVSAADWSGRYADAKATYPISRLPKR